GELAGADHPPKPPGPLAQLTQSTLPKLGRPLMPSSQEERTRLQTRLLHAGLYGRHAVPLFFGVKLLLMVAPAVLGLLAGLFHLLPFPEGLVYGALAGSVGFFGPSFWLDFRKAQRQGQLRRSLPDALDVIVICLEGGLSLLGAFRRVVSELAMAYPLLAREMNIVQREIQLGR